MKGMQELSQSDQPVSDQWNTQYDPSVTFSSRTPGRCRIMAEAKLEVSSQSLVPQVGSNGERWEASSSTYPCHDMGTPESDDSHADRPGSRWHPPSVPMGSLPIRRLWRKPVQ